MKKFILFILIGIVYNTNAQEKFTVSGYAKDLKNGEALIGVTVYKKNYRNIGILINLLLRGLLGLKI